MSDATARVLSAIAAKSNVQPIRSIEPEWANLDVDTLPKEAQSAYATYKAAAKIAAEQRTAFETIVTDLVDPKAGEKLIFGYRFGKLSVAIVPADKPKSRTNAISLAALKAR